MEVKRRIPDCLVFLFEILFLHQMHLQFHLRTQDLYFLQLLRLLEDYIEEHRRILRLQYKLDHYFDSNKATKKSV